MLLLDLYQEPGNVGPADGMRMVIKEDKSLLQLEIHRWTRNANSSQPLTNGVWIKAWSGEMVIVFNRFMLANSDVIEFHC